MLIVIGVPWNGLVLVTIIKEKLYQQPSIIFLLNLMEFKLKFKYSTNNIFIFQIIFIEVWLLRIFIALLFTKYGSILFQSS